MRSKFFLSCWPILILSFGCNSDEMKVFDRPNKDPLSIPDEISLFHPRPILRATFEVTELGYRPIKLETSNGTHSFNLHQNRAVKIRALDGEHREITVVSVFNPRIVYPVGKTEADSIEIIDKAVFEVFLEKPDEIKFLEVTVRNGPNRGFKEIFPVTTEPSNPNSQNSIITY